MIKQGYVVGDLVFWKSMKGLEGIWKENHFILKSREEMLADEGDQNNDFGE